MTESFSKLVIAFLAVFIFSSCCSDYRNTKDPHKLLSSPQVVEAASKANAVLSRNMICWKGGTPVFDGRIDKDEYADASHFAWNEDWIEAMPQEIESPEDLNFEGWVKHDGEYLYLALDVQDDLFYGIETERWLPPQDPNAHVIGEREQGRPWFGDMVELLLYGRMMDLQIPTADVAGDGRGIQIIYNLTKSLEGGVGVPGMLPHGPGRTVENFENNKRWILEDIIETRTVRHDELNRYMVEVRILLNGGIEIEEGIFWSMDKPDTVIGFNLSIGDVDGQDKSPDGRLHHETWWAGKMTSGDGESRRKYWGILIMTSKERKSFEQIN
jgi:SSS family solute:Na+ symporter